MADTTNLDVVLTDEQRHELDMRYLAWMKAEQLEQAAAVMASAALASGSDRAHEMGVQHMAKIEEAQEAQDRYEALLRELGVPSPQSADSPALASLT